MAQHKPEPSTGPSAPRCPVCGRPCLAETRPFCSQRCADVDLGRWLTGEYRIPGEVIDESEGEEDEA
jgi:uncharacterized protein